MHRHDLFEPTLAAHYSIVFFGCAVEKASDAGYISAYPNDFAQDDGGHKKPLGISIHCGIEDRYEMPLVVLASDSLYNYRTQ